VCSHLQVLPRDALALVGQLAVPVPDSRAEVHVDVCDEEEVHEDVNQEAKITGRRVVREPDAVRHRDPHVDQ
jgi:hypothetical protein